jgi:hypothetical protein
MILYKWTRADGSREGYTYPLPHDGQPGEWTSEVKDIEMCKRGYHLCADPYDFLRYGPRLFIAEGRGKHKGPDAVGKTVWASVRLLHEVPITETDLRLLACDYAEHVLTIFERTNSEDKRPRTAIETARKYVRGEATLQDLHAAAYAAYVAAYAADAAAYAAAYAADAAANAAAAYVAATAYAADAAAYAADAAATAYTDADAYAGERKWQRERFADLLKRLQGGRDKAGEA